MKGLLRNFGPAAFIPLLLVLALVIACGAAAPEQEPAAPADPAAAPPAAADPAQPPPTPTPVAQPAPATAPPAAATPAGTLNAGLPELGTFSGHPTRAVIPAGGTNNSAPIGESLMLLDINAQVQGRLVESWSISQDATTWTLNLPRGVQFHKGYGEMTAEDVAWSFAEGWAHNERHSRLPHFQAFWTHPEGSVETPDPHTVVVNTGVPLSAANEQQEWMIPSSAASWVASKQQHEEIGFEAADRDPALTGPWEIVDYRTGEFWRMRAVPDHWRQTPHFDELVFWELPEESARLAGFQTGQLDTFTMSTDSIPLVESVPGASLMVLPGGAEYMLNFYGGYYAEAAAGDPPAAYDPDLPWVSTNFDVDSDEWHRAANVRRALIMAVDREIIIETILGGYARPGLLRRWAHNEHRLGDRRWEYNPDRARELLAEAGYGDGFNITLTPAIRAAPGEVELCEAIATMWNNELGLDVRFQRIPYATLQPQMGTRTYVGATCHGAAQRFIVGADPQLTMAGGISFGGTHPFMEEITARVEGAVIDAERERLEEEWGRWVFDNAFTAVVLIVGNTVWPVGPNIQEWSEGVNIRDLRLMNGYEHIRPRQ